MKVKRNRNLAESCDSPVVTSAAEISGCKMQRALVPSRDCLEEAGPSPTDSSIKSLIAWTERVTGKKVDYQTRQQLAAYRRSLTDDVPVSDFDPEGWLQGLGISFLRGSGRSLDDMLEAVSSLPDYRPKKSAISRRFFWLLMKSRALFDVAAAAATRAYEAPSRHKARWEQPFTSSYSSRPDSAEPPVQHYEGAIKRARELGSAPWSGFYPDEFHMGDSHGQPGQNYGTFAIATYLGFLPEQAKRIGNADRGIDRSTTIYGKTSSSPFGAVDRHFNLSDSGKEDTRLIWARRHLAEAVRLGRNRAYEAAEKELGHGLHSLQDLFAHGQLRGVEHGTLGQFPDAPEDTPVALASATVATSAYLLAFLREVTAEN